MGCCNKKYSYLLTVGENSVERQYVVHGKPVKTREKASTSSECKPCHTSVGVGSCARTRYKAEAVVLQVILRIECHTDVIFFEVSGETTLCERPSASEHVVRCVLCVCAE
jgi:hypothetical protein